MRTKDFVSAVTACGLLGMIYTAPVRASAAEYVCEDFEHKFKGELELVHPFLGLQCSVVAKAHVDPRNSCTSKICVSVHAFNALPEVGAPLEIEVVSECIDSGTDGTGISSGLPAIGGAAGPGAPPLETSVCLGGAALGRAFFPGTPEGSAAGVFYGQKDGRIKVSCDDGTAKTKGNYEYVCRQLPD